MSIMERKGRYRSGPCGGDDVDETRCGGALCSVAENGNLVVPCFVWVMLATKAGRRETFGIVVVVRATVAKPVVKAFAVSWAKAVAKQT